MRLIRILYQSQSKLAAAPQRALLNELLTKAQTNNQRDGITGLLVADDLWFVQVLEGSQKVVWSTYERIKADNRHRSVMLLDVRDVEERQFADWSMALITRTVATDAVFKVHGQATFNPPRLPSIQLLRLIADLSATVQDG